MNNNRGNNRRRGRGSNRPQGGQQINRIDSRARGNAPQLLEKYKKLAHDAHLNGDRVQEEYYLQFADHYFRVMADQRQRQEESRQPRRDDRSQDYGDETGSEDETYGETARPSQDRAYQDRPYQDRAYQDRGPRGDRSDRGQRGDSDERATQTSEASDESGPENEHPVYEPVENPFVRGARGGLKQRKPRRDRDEGETNAPAGEQDEHDKEAASGNFDPSALPPAISAKTDEKPKRRARTKADDSDAGENGEEKPRARRRTRKASPPADEAGDNPLETVN